jgi:hypothetical protein
MYMSEVATPTKEGPNSVMVGGGGQDRGDGGGRQAAHRQVREETTKGTRWSIDRGLIIVNFIH